MTVWAHIVKLTDGAQTMPDEGMAVAVILHELAHAWGFCRAVDRDEFSDERLAWEQAIAWALESSLSYELKRGVLLYARCATIADVEPER